MKRYYLDNCATTPLSAEAAEAMVSAMRDVGGNPSSIHHEGRLAARLLADSRRVIADSLGARPAEIVFTGSGTEANNLAIRGVISRAIRETGRARVITSRVEHASVQTPLEWEKRVHGDSLDVISIGVDSEGLLKLDELDSALAGGEISLVTLLLVNNETGVIQDLDQLKQRKLKYPMVPWHLDAVQAYTKLPLDMHLLPFDLVTLAAHKIHGPKGIGALYLRGGTEVDPLIVGGAQEKYRRAGTENTVAAAGFAAAVKAAPSAEELHTHLAALEAIFLQELDTSHIDYQINGPDGNHTRRLPGFLNLTFPGIASREDLQIALDLDGVSLSSTSACHSGVVEESHVLRAMGLSGDALSGAIRLQFDYSHSLDDARACARIISTVVSRILQADSVA